MLQGVDLTVERARALRKDMSLPEVLLWRALRLRPNGYKFRRQHPAGPYVADFFCHEARLVIEIDGEAHERGDQGARDQMRDRWFEERRFEVLRIAAREVLDDVEVVVRAIVARCRASTPLHHASPDGCCTAAARSACSPGTCLTCSPPPLAGED